MEPRTNSARTFLSTWRNLQLISPRMIDSRVTRRFETAIELDHLWIIETDHNGNPSDTNQLLDLRDFILYKYLLQ